jgi:hypothetical protein
MATNYWRNRTGGTADTQQVWKGTITTTTNGHTYAVTLTDDKGNTGVVTYEVVNPPDTTVTLVATGFITAWNASTHPLVSKITATQSAGQVILTADTAGVPFTASTSGTGTWSGTGNTTANVGIYDYNTAENWSLNAVPVATNDVVLAGPTSGNATAIKYGLNQSGVALEGFYTQQDYNAQIGREEDGVSYYLRIDPNLMDHKASSSLALIDIGSAAIAPYIECNGTAASNKYALYLLGSGITTLEVRKGRVGVAVLPGETSTATTVLCSFLTTLASDVNLTLGSGLTLTTLTQSGGTCTQLCASTTTTNASGTTLTTDGTGAITTLNVYGTTYPNSTGTVTTLNLFGTVNETRDRSARTISTTNAKPGSTLYRLAAVTHTTMNLPTDPGVFTYEVVG